MSEFALYDQVGEMDAMQPDVMEDGADGVENGNLDLDELEAGVPVQKEGRIIRKAKRPSKTVNIVGEAGSNGLTSPVGNGNHNLQKALLLNAKNSRRPRNLKGRGLPKKGEIHPSFFTLSQC